MATSAYSTEHSTVQVKKATYVGGLRFDWLMALLSIWFVSGLFIDGWAHAHGAVDNTFFTPWHAILYSGYGVTALALIVATIVNHQRGRAWIQAIPRGYELSLLGVPLFVVGGVGDLIWHTLFGFEVGIEPLLSPTHLMLACAGLLMMSGALRSIWLRNVPEDQQNWRTLFPALLSLLVVFSVLTFFTSYAHPVIDTWLVTNALDDSSKSRGVIAIMFATVMMMGVVLLALRRWRLPVGSMTLLIALNAALMTVFADTYILIPGALLAGIVADVLLWRLKPSAQNVGALRIFAFLVPLTFFLFYFATLGLTTGISWTIHLWLGSSLITGVLGLFVSYLVVAPQGPALEEE